MKPKAGMKLRRPHLKLMYVLVPNDELQTSYDVLCHINQGCAEPAEWHLAISTFFSLTEALVEQYSPPFKGGQEWDNRRREK